MRPIEVERANDDDVVNVEPTSMPAPIGIYSLGNSD
jgi:hypothetical protein